MERVVVAGATGGIGRAIVERLLTHPDREVWGLCRQPDQERDWCERMAGRLHLIRWDAREPEQIAGQLRASLPDRTTLDGLIYAAGRLHGEGLQPEKRLEDLDADSMAQAFAINATAFPLLVRSLLPWFRHPGLKRFMAVSAKVGSIDDNRMGGWYAYRASKAALNMFTRNLSIELPRRLRSVACVAVHPGTTRTALSAPFEQSLAQLRVHTPDDTAGNLLTIFDALTSDDNGRFINWDGRDLPW